MVLRSSQLPSALLAKLRHLGGRCRRLPRRSRVSLYARRLLLPCLAPEDPPVSAQSAREDSDDPVQLLESLRAARRAQRTRKKERRRAAKQAATDASQPPTSAGFSPLGGDHQTPQGAAGPRAEPGGSSAAAPAQASCAPLARSPSQPLGAPTESVKSGTVRARIQDDVDNSGALRASRPATSTASHTFAAGQSPPRQGGTSAGRITKARRR